MVLRSEPQVNQLNTAYVQVINGVHGGGDAQVVTAQAIQNTTNGVRDIFETLFREIEQLKKNEKR